MSPVTSEQAQIRKGQQNCPAWVAASPLKWHRNAVQRLIMGRSFVQIRFLKHHTTQLQKPSISWYHPMLTDAQFAELMARTRSGDQDAAQQLVREYEPEIRRAARLRLTDPKLRRIVDSIDICQ